jgi:hypothetical protein
MSSLGNRTFQGFDLKPDMARRLDDMLRSVASTSDGLTSLQASAITEAQAKAIAAAEARTALQTPGVVLNITNAIGTAGSPQPALIPTVTTLPPGAGSSIGQAVIYQNDIWVWSGTAWVMAVNLILSDTHAHRLTNYNPASLVSVTLFWETDRKVLYAAVAGAWVFATGVMQDAAANRPLDLGATDVNLLFIGTDTKIMSRWNGASWEDITQRGTIVDTRINRNVFATVTVSAYTVAWVSGTTFDASWLGRPIVVGGIATTVSHVTSSIELLIAHSFGLSPINSILYFYSAAEASLGTQFYESDTALMYIAIPAVGFVNTSGTTVTFASSFAGDHFDVRWFGRSITINGLVYTIDSTVPITSTTLELMTTAGTQTNVPYSVSPGVWRYETGIYITAASAISTLVAGLVLGWPDRGLQVHTTDTFHIVEYNGNPSTPWFFPCDPAGAVSIGPQPLGGLWYLCDGSTVPIRDAGGSVSYVVTAPISSTVAALMGGGGSTWVTDTGNVAFPATSPTWDAAHKATETESTHTHNVANTIQVVDLGGTPKNAVDAQTSTAGTAHAHALSDANAKLNPPSVAAGGLPAYIKLAAWIRG